MKRLAILLALFPLILSSQDLKEFEKKMPTDFRVNVVLIAPACTFDCLADSLCQAGTRVEGRSSES